MKYPSGSNHKRRDDSGSSVYLMRYGNHELRFNTLYTHKPTQKTRVRELSPSPGKRNTDRSVEIKKLHHKYHVTNKIRDLYRLRFSLYISIHMKLSACSYHVERAHFKRKSPVALPTTEAAFVACPCKSRTHDRTPVQRYKNYYTVCLFTRDRKIAKN